jgi:2-polyprenyl-3-methyl-5-hydroxy-6-metoxy-1,4-benzoquinol methylase
MFHVEQMELLSECPVCKGNSQEKVMNCKDFTVSAEDFTIVKCKGCSFLFTNPRPDKTEIGRYYKSTNYISHSDTSKGLVNRIYKLVRRMAVSGKYRLVKPYLSSPALLDIGAGTGYFLAYCRSKGLKVSGVEPDSDARATAHQIHQISLLQESTLAEMNSESFSVITMWHVLEHVHDLHDRIREIDRLLLPGGRLIVAVPNHRSFDARHYQADWAAYDTPRHLYHFDPDSIRNLFERFGFRLEEIKPMVWDSFYVSLLSEKYQSGKTNYLKAFLIGLFSNLLAKKGEHSSQIYIISKRSV